MQPLVRNLLLAHIFCANFFINVMHQCPNVRPRQTLFFERHLRQLLHELQYCSIRAILYLRKLC
eukprot:3798819-Karenia_brevis.AAC.1